MTTLQTRVTGTQISDAPTTTTSHAMSPAARSVLAGVRIALGFVFLWAFLDKAFGLGHDTTAKAAWVNGGNPTKGFLANGAKGPFAGFYHSIAGTGFTNWLFMLALLGVGVALILGVGMRIAAAAGTLLVVMMWAVVLPRPTTRPWTITSSTPASWSPWPCSTRATRSASAASGAAPRWSSGSPSSGKTMDNSLRHQVHESRGPDADAAAPSSAVTGATMNATAVGAVIPAFIPVADAATRTTTAVLSALGSTVDGLPDLAEVNRRRSVAGPNAVTTHRVSALAVLLRQLRSALLGLLAIAAIGLVLRRRAHRRHRHRGHPRDQRRARLRQRVPRRARRAPRCTTGPPSAASSSAAGQASSVDVVDLVPGDVISSNSAWWSRPTSGC